MDDPMSHANDDGPLDIWVLASHLFTDVVGGLAYGLERVKQRKSEHCVFVQVLAAPPFYESRCVSQRLKHVLQPNTVIRLGVCP
jgi:hypothetical protein